MNKAWFAPGLVLVLNMAMACPIGGLDVVGSEKEKEIACEGARRAQSFFEKNGYTIPSDWHVQVVFKDVVYSPCSPSVASGGCSPIKVAALFNAATSTIEMTSNTAPWMKSAGRTYFKRGYTKEVYESVLLHEMVHSMNKSFYSYTPKSHAQDEYLAYAAQLGSLSEKERGEILKNYPLPQFSFDVDTQINDFIHASLPHGFGVMSYRHFSGPSGGRKMMERIYSGDFTPPSVSDE